MTAEGAGFCECCAGLGDWWEGPLGLRIHVVCTYCKGQGEYPVLTPASGDSQVSS